MRGVRLVHLRTSGCGKPTYLLHLPPTVDGLRASVAGFIEQLREGDELGERDLEQTLALVEFDDLSSIIHRHATAGELLDRIAKSTDKRAADLDAVRPLSAARED